jgi:hypothetical protein
MVYAREFHYVISVYIRMHDVEKLDEPTEMERSQLHQETKVRVRY